MIKHFCNDEKNCDMKDCVVCLLPNVVCESSFTTSRYLEGPCCQACEHNEAMYNHFHPEMGQEEVIHAIRVETLKAMFSPLQGGAANG